MRAFLLVSIFSVPLHLVFYELDFLCYELRREGPYLTLPTNHPCSTLNIYEPK